MHRQLSRRRCRWWCPMISRMSHRSEKSQKSQHPRGETGTAAARCGPALPERLELLERRQPGVAVEQFRLIGEDLMLDER